MAEKIDFKDALEMAGETDPAEASGLLKLINKFNQLSGILALLGIDVKGLLKGLIAKYKADKDKAPAPSTAPTAPTAPAPTAPPVATDPAPPVATAREITSFRLKGFWYEPNGGAGPVPKAHFDEITNQTEPMVPRSRYAVDCDPLDQFGKEYFTDAEDPIFWRQPGEPEPNTHRMRWFFEGGDDVAEIGGAEPNGMVPKIKIGKDSLSEKGKDYQTGQLFGVWTRADGSTFESPRYPSLRAKR